MERSKGKNEEGRLSLAKQFGMQIYTQLNPAPTLKKIPYAFAKKHQLILLDEDESTLTIALADPLNLSAVDELQLMTDKKVKAVFAEEELILAAIQKEYHHKEGATQELIAGLQEKPLNENGVSEEGYDLLDSGNEAPIIRLLNLILSEAIEQRASDIHFEPFDNDLVIRYRIDGMLQKRHSPPQEYQSQILTRIKVMAKLDIAEYRLPQDGRMKLKMGGKEIDFRVSTLPTSYGERIVLRILDRSSVTFGLDTLGMLPSMLDSYRELIKLPEGLILVTGPTGSGKSTTLYGTLTEIANEENNIMTVEDPIEYKLKGIAQMGVKPKIGLTFAAGLRHILRQDPDVVMVGEIRDAETAEIAIQASLTGHLVLSTLHTNDAPSSVVRLTDMGIEPYLLSSSLVGVLAQRLLRKICPHCREAYEPKQKDSEGFIKGIIYRGRGCPHCYGTGYKGRHGIYELLVVDSEIQAAIANRKELGELRALAMKRQNFMTLREHGEHLVRTGITTLAEMVRVTRKNFVPKE